MSTVTFDDKDPFLDGPAGEVEAEADRQFYEDLQRDMVASDKENLDNSMWWFWTLSAFLFVLFVIVVIVMLRKFR